METCASTSSLPTSHNTAVCPEIAKRIRDGKEDYALFDTGLAFGDCGRRNPRLPNGRLPHGPGLSTSDGLALGNCANSRAANRIDSGEHLAVLSRDQLAIDERAELLVRE